MRPFIPLILLTLAAATPALAQTAPWPQAWPNATVGDRHRYENDRLRVRNDANAALARQQQVETRLRLNQLQATRQPTPPSQPEWRPLRTPEQERALREAATARRETVVQGVSGIDAWLDRMPQP